MSASANALLIAVLAAVAHASSLDPKELDCSMRKLAYDYARKLQPWRGSQQDVFDSLELHTLCGQAPPTSSSHQASPPLSRPRQGIFVDAAHGSDQTGQGSIDKPLASLARALQESRLRAGNRTIVLREGIHYLKATLELDSSDSGLTITNYQEETAWISGGVMLAADKIGWQTEPADKATWQADVSQVLGADADVTGLFTVEPHRRMTRARYPNADVEDWDAGSRYLHGDQPEVLEWHRPPAGDLPAFTYYDLQDPGNPTGVEKNDSTMGPYNTYATGKGGVCASVWGNGSSYWCGNGSAGGWANVDKAAALAGRLNIPVAMTYNTSDPALERLQKWKNPAGAIVHVSHTQGWSWHMFEVSGFDPNAGNLTFSRGGWQGGRNWQCKDAQNHLSDCNGEGKRLGGGNWYVDGVREELDAPGEFFFSKQGSDKGILYFRPNGTGSPPDLIVPQLQTLIAIRGSKAKPVKNITIQGVNFRDASKTFMEQWGVPSGGDWSLYRGGAVFLEGTHGVTIKQSTFQRLDGNCIFLAGYNRNTTLQRNEFAWIGDGAMATWGNTEEYDATQAEVPQGTMVLENVVHDIGLYEKQSSAWGQAKACLTTIRGNIMFNLPRAAINFNDNLGGANVVEENLIFNTCRESGDHGPINSWDRLPFLTSLRGFPSYDPLPTETRHNFIIANYGGSQAFDNDDGSSFYHTHDNVFYSSDGFKMDYGGHDSVFSSNLVVVLPYDGQNCFNVGSFLKGHGDTMSNNTCVVLPNSRGKGSESVAHVAQCNSAMVTLKANHYFTPLGNATLNCGNRDSTLADVQAQGLDLGSTSAKLPTSDSIMSHAKSLLGFMGQQLKVSMEEVLI